jgi:hypothetical protein
MKLCRSVLAAVALGAGALVAAGGIALAVVSGGAA